MQCERSPFAPRTGCGSSPFPRCIAFWGCGEAVDMLLHEVDDIQTIMTAHGISLCSCCHWLRWRVRGF